MTLFLHDRSDESRWFSHFGPSVRRVDAKQVLHNLGKGTRTEDKTVLPITLV